MLFIELVRLGAKELSFQVSNDRLSFGQLLRLEREILLQLRGIFGQPGRIIGKLAQQFFRRLHPWSASRNLRPNG